MNQLKKYLLVKYTYGGHVDKSVGNQGEVEEYGFDPEHALERAMEKRGGSRAYWAVIGEIKTL